ncbi:MAG TPA: DUF551 domain-containing protein [Hymenobacter sp.]
MSTPYIPTKEFLTNLGFTSAQFNLGWPKSYTLPDSPEGVKYDLKITEQGRGLLFEMQPGKLVLTRRYVGLLQSDAFLVELLRGLEWPIRLQAEARTKEVTLVLSHIQADTCILALEQHNDRARRLDDPDLEIHVGLRNERDYFIYLTLQMSEYMGEDRLFNLGWQANRIAEKTAYTGWIPVTDRLPELAPGCHTSYGVLAVEFTGSMVLVCYSPHYKQWLGLDYQPRITHWQPLPAAPQEGGQANA